MDTRSRAVINEKISATLQCKKPNRVTLPLLAHTLPNGQHFGFWVNLNSKINLANLYPATQKRHADKRQQCGASTFESFRPLWPPWTQANLSVEKLPL